MLGELKSKKAPVIIAVVVFFVSLLGATIFFAAEMKNSSQPVKPGTVISSPQATAVGNTAENVPDDRFSVYVLTTDDNGVLLVYPASGGEPQSTGIFVFTLPSADRASLARGLTVEGEAELDRLIEELRS